VSDTNNIVIEDLELDEKSSIFCAYNYDLLTHLSKVKPIHLIDLRLLWSFIFKLFI